MVQHVKDLMEYWDFEQNQKIGLNPENIPINSYKVAFWKCPNGHFWKEKISTMFRRKVKCFYCAGRLVWTGENDLQTLYPDIASEWDYDKNDITPDKVSPRDTNTYWWRCKNGHPSFPRSVEHRVNRHDTCPYCSGRKVIKGVNDLQTLYPKIAAEWDYEGNGGVLPSEVSANTWKSYKWICPKGHHYPMKVHLRTHSIKSIDCPKCIKAHSTSFPEQAVYYYTKQFYPDAINRYKGLSDTGLELDIYIPSWKIGIEYDGKVFHSSEEAKKREQRKYKICKEKGIKLIRIREDEDFTTTFEHPSDEIYYIKKRPNDSEMNNFLIFFFTELTEWSHSHYVFYEDPVTKKRNVFFGLPVDINIKRDRPKILEYLIDVDKSFGALYPELAKNWDKEKNGKLTPFMLLPGSNYIAFFKCPRCGKGWSAAICTVVKLKKELCNKCSMGDNGLNCSRRAAKENGSFADNCKELVDQWDQEANGELTPHDIPLNYSREVFWKCPVCNYQWSQSPAARTHKDRISGCPHCTGRVAMPGVDDLETLYPDIAAEWDYSKNKGLVPSQIKPHSNIKRFWICSKHNVGYETSPANRVNGGGCKLCKSEKIQSKNGFRVERYSKTLEYIKTYGSINEAGRELDISPEAIRQAVLNGCISAESYWKYEGSEFGTLKPDKKHRVIGTNIKTGESAEFESAREAERQTGIGHSRIMKCCKETEPKKKETGGYRWDFVANS